MLVPVPVVVECFFFLKNKLLSEELTSAIFSFIFVGKMCVSPKNGLLISSGKRHIPKQNHGNRRGCRRKKVTTTMVNPGNR